MAPIFLLDEQIGPRIAREVRRLGLDAATVAEEGLAGADDEAVLRFAIARGRIVVTYDVKTLPRALEKLLAEGANPPGVIFVRTSAVPSSKVGVFARALRNLALRIEDGEVDPGGGVFLGA